MRAGSERSPQWSGLVPSAVDQAIRLRSRGANSCPVNVVVLGIQFSVVIGFKLAHLTPRLTLQGFRLRADGHRDVSPECAGG
jgi:hypothetical protein